MHLISRKVKVGRPILAPSSGLSPAPPTSYAAQFAWQLLSLTCTLNNSRHIVWVNLPVSHVRLFVLCVCVCVCVCVLIYPPPSKQGVELPATLTPEMIPPSCRDPSLTEPPPIAAETIGTGAPVRKELKVG